MVPNCAKHHKHSADVMTKALPSIKKVFIYRDPVPTILLSDELFITTKMPFSNMQYINVWEDMAAITSASNAMFTHYISDS